MTEPAISYRLKAEGFLRDALAATDLDDRGVLIGKANYWNRKAREAAGLVRGPANPLGRFAPYSGFQRRAG